MKANEPKMDIYQFGKQLLETNDLDPVYVMLYNSELMHNDPLLYKWLLAYWAFYHVGTASFITGRGEENMYWQRFLTAAGSKDYPRSSERRHFRGRTSLKSTRYLQYRGVDTLFSDLMAAPNNAESVMNVVKSWYGFGPWISFKVADMLERLGMRPITFDLKTVMYDSPLEAASLMWHHHYSGGASEPVNVGKWAVETLLVSPELSRKAAPPDFERKLGFQEAETILCKWKSYMNGHYHVGEDVEAVRSGLLRFSKCTISQWLIRGGKKGGLWS